ncbi:hypothetical protein N9X87_00555, partial [bacterium]|nr:hypothetical protein [bacterium]
NLVPMEFEWFRSRVYRNPNAEGSAAAWKTLTGRDSNKQLGYVAEGMRAGAVQLTKGSGSAAYAVWGVEDSYTQESSSRGASLFQSPGGIKDLCISNLMQTFATKEERILTFANRDVALGTPAAPTGVAASGGTLAADDYWAVVVALTADGKYLASSTMATGITKQQAVTSLVGETYNLNAGCSKRGTDSLAVASSGSQKITWSIAAVKGAVAYAWYIGKNTTTIPADTALYLHAITYVNQYECTAYATSGQALSAVALSTTDWSKEDTYAPGGIFYQALASSDCYYLSLDNAALTMTNGIIDQINAMFLSMFNTQGVGPEALHMSPLTYAFILGLAFSSSNPRVMFIIEENVSSTGLTLGGSVKGIRNPYTGGVAEVVVNPNMPDSMIFAARLTYAVPSTPSPRSVEVETFGGLWRVDWQPTTRKFTHGAYMQGAIKLYVPGCFGVISNIDIS